MINDLDIGGAEHHLVQLGCSLARSDLRPAVYVLTHKGVLAPRLEDQEVAVIAPPFSACLARLPRRLFHLSVLPLSVLGLLLALARLRPRIVHFFLPAAYLVGGMTSLLVPVATRIMSRRSQSIYQRRHPIARRVERWLHGRMDAILGNSAAVVDELRVEGVPKARLGLIRNGVALGSPAPCIDRGLLRSAEGLPERGLVILNVANLIPYKGHADLIEAVGRISNDLPRPWRLCCIGRDDGLRPALQARAARLGIAANLLFVEARRDISAFYRMADLFVLSSHEEGFPNVVLEAMAAGLPVVATDVGGVRDAVVDGETGRLVEARNPAALAAAIAELASDPAKRAAMGRAGRARVESLFSLDGCVDRYARLYRGLLSDREASVEALINGADLAE